MSNTVDFTINAAGWVEISTGGLNGFMTNVGSTRAMYREDANDPTTSVDTGHTLLPKANISFSLLAGQKVWVRSKSGSGKIIVTPEA